MHSQTRDHSLRAEARKEHCLEQAGVHQQRTAGKDVSGNPDIGRSRQAAGLQHQENVAHLSCCGVDPDFVAKLRPKDLELVSLWNEAVILINYAENHCDWAGG